MKLNKALLEELRAQTAELAQTNELLRRQTEIMEDELHRRALLLAKQQREEQALNEWSLLDWLPFIAIIVLIPLVLQIIFVAIRSSQQSKVTASATPFILH